MSDSEGEDDEFAHVMSTPARSTRGAGPSSSRPSRAAPPKARPSGGGGLLAMPPPPKAAQPAPPSPLAAASPPSASLTLSPSVSQARSGCSSIKGRRPSHLHVGGASPPVPLHSAPVVSSRSGPGPGGSGGSFSGNGGGSARDFSNSGGMLPRRHSMQQQGKTGSSPSSNKVGDHHLSSSVPSPTFMDNNSSGEDNHRSMSSVKGIVQHGRHGSGLPASSGNSNNGVPTGAPSLGRRGSKMLKPSAQQQAAPSLQKSPSVASTAGADLASRRWKNDSGAMTFKQQLALASKPEGWADAALAATHLVDVWNHYDSNGSGELDKSELLMLAGDVVDRFCALYEEQLRRERPGLGADEAFRLARRDVFPHLLAGESVVEAKRLMAERLFKLLDVDRDGVITRTEFLFSWKNISKQVLTLKGSNIPQGLACVIL